MRQKYAIVALVATGSLVLDQVTKTWIRNTLPLGARPVDVIDNLFRIVHAENEGAAWGILSDAHWRIPFFIVTTTLALGVIGYYLRQLADDDRVQALGLSLILGGALGNFLDRLIYQSVTDFIEVYAGAEPYKGFFINVFGSYRWPAWNVADAAIVVGIGLILYHIFFIEPKLLKAAAQTSETGPTSAVAEGP